MMHCTLIGDHSVLMDFSKSMNPLEQIHGISKMLFTNKPSWAAEITPGLDSLVIKLQYLDGEPDSTRNLAIAELTKLAEKFQKLKIKAADANSIHRIQVCYHPDLSLDLAPIAHACNMTIQEVINLHKSATYTADILGFMPGFAYFSGLDPKLKLPRLPSPRPAVPKGSVAIAELQTAIYPRTTPGGWNIIGRSPNALFDIEKHPPGLFMAGDQMQIDEISLDEFSALDKSNTRPEFIRATADPIKNALIEITQGGTLTTIQDEPRQNLSHWAVGPGGACDLRSLQLANALVANPLDMAAIEMTSTGPSILFHADTCIAWVGANCEAIVNGARIPGNRPVWIAHGSSLKFSPLNPGFRAVLSIGGGLDLPDILERKGSHLSADIGHKRLEKGDVLFLKNPQAPLRSEFLKKLHQNAPLPSFPKWKIRSPFLPSSSVTSIYCLPGPHLHFLTAKDRNLFWSSIWTVSNQSNRMGVRLQSDFKIKKSLPNIPSQAITFGTVQFPSSQEPIVMLAEHQTTGGYPRLAEVIQSDQVKLAQMKPGDKLQLIPIDLQEADRLNAEALKLQASTINSIKAII
ncbi:5-oxoprolinase/urea amidolyase family protein [Polynucleobacter sp. AP-Nino-20-G2]|uniref:5-oxoprolinase subunit B/C family protein n=1 Tax=Polynucleobacter sp. AP-Nino-20-G2 TaxID=2576917 RepID=UPI001BFDEEB7|nr:5-oxoprolinase/urea amidolyase family protein [Polynucleobacter sp. AP-Nino-20-G2]QWE16040.1 5-oxoprolinase/urea amidolyase family protein [Polynucleobacter sp. AP-Nino-20-G2]